MSEIPIIKLPKMRSSGDDWCKHYAGFFNPGHLTGKKTHCDAGVEYASVAVKVDFKTQRQSESTPYLQHKAYPCFKHQAHLTMGCSKCQYPTPEELDAKHKEWNEQFYRTIHARKAILADLKSRYDNKVGGVRLVERCDDEVESELVNFHAGHGSVACPVCHKGTLKYSRASYNGHVHANCSTIGCVAWKE